MPSSRASRSKARRTVPPPDVAARVPRASRAGWVWGAALACVTLLVYANSLKGPFVFDDLLSVVENASIRDLSRPGAVLQPERELPTAGRPLVNLSFALNYAVGGLGVTG